MRIPLICLPLSILGLLSFALFAPESNLFPSAPAVAQPASIFENPAEFMRAFEARYIPSAAMQPTLQPGDRMLIDKLAYESQSPERGDIILFSPTDRLRQENPGLRDLFVKRVIGLPTEKVEIRDGRVYINDVPLNEEYIAAEPEYQWGAEVIPADSYFVLGDNRNNSYDSHFWGYVPRDLVIGQVVGIFCPIARQTLLDSSPRPIAQTVLAEVQQLMAIHFPNCTLDPLASR